MDDVLLFRSPSREQGGCWGCSRTRWRDVYVTIFGVSTGTMGMFLLSCISSCGAHLHLCSPSLRDDNICHLLCSTFFWRRMTKHSRFGVSEWRLTHFSNSRWGSLYQLSFKGIIERIRCRCCGLVATMRRMFPRTRISSGVPHAPVRPPADGRAGDHPPEVEQGLGILSRRRALLFRFVS